jgi:drug/metabolite transporter superfamily protein YnfA
MRNPAVVAAGSVITLLGLVFFLQGVGVLKGSSMSNTTTWSVAGPVIALVGLAIAVLGFRGRGDR